MKNARYLVVTTIGLLAFANPAIAESDTPPSVDNPYTQYDPDGVPYAATRPQDRELTPDEIAAIQKAQAKAALDKDWLLRTYERQMQSHTGDAKNAQSSNLYYQISSNKDLAKLAGLPEIDSAEQEGTVPVPLSNSGPAKLHPISSPAITSLSPFHADLMKPLITPLGAPEAAGLHDFYSSFLTDSIASPNTSNTPKKPRTPRTEDPTDPADIETPGMIAAEKDPLLDTNSTDLSLELLPGESVEQATLHQDNNAKLELPLPMNATQLHREQAIALSPPQAPTAMPATTAITTKPAKTGPLDDPEAPIPVSKEPQINPIRPAIGSPFDILDR